MSPELIVAGVAIAFLAATCQSVTGFGFALTMTPLLALAWDIKPTIATSILLGVLILFPLLAEVRGSVSVGRVFGMLVGFVFGVIPGIILLERLDEEALRVMVAATVILASVLLYFSPRPSPGRASGEDSIPMRLIAGALSGAIGTSTSLGGPPVVLYLLGRERNISSFRATIMVFFLPASTLTLLAFIAVGQVTRDVLVMSAAALPAMALGIVFGTWLRRRLDPQRFRGIVLAVLVATSVAVLIGSAARL